MGRGRILALPYPAQGHVSSMMAFCRTLEKHGFKITFVNTDFNHKRIVRAGVGKDSVSMGSNNINFVSIPDGLDPEDERNEFEFPKLCQSMLLTMPAKLEELIQGINNNAAAARGGSSGSTDDDDDDKITCFITEFGMSWALEVAYKMGIKGAAYYPMCATFCNATSFIAPNMELGAFLDSDGIKGCGTDQLPQEVRKILSLPTGDLDPKIMFEYSARGLKAMEKTEWWLCNSAYELEPDEFAKVPRLLPIGPNQIEISGSSRAQFFQEDSSCLEWLDQQPHCSVIYVAFGSIATLEPTQFQELALGLDLTNRPYLWVVRPNFMKNSSSCAFPDEFKGTHGKIVTWAPQPRVLNHPSIACFLSHCGWTSTIEGLSSAVPFLCWPFFADQITNKMNICDVWKVGVGFDPDDNHGIIRRNEIKKKVDLLFGDDNIRARSSQLRDTVLSTTAEGGRSSKNLNNFLNWLRE